MHSLPPEKALLRYMNNMASHGLASKLKLKRRGDRWNVVEFIDQLQIEESSNPDPQERPQKPRITFSFYAPWVNSGQLKAHRNIAQRDRMKAAARVKPKTDDLL
jgi:hypothetical protein